MTPGGRPVHRAILASTVGVVFSGIVVPRFGYRVVMVLG